MNIFWKVASILAYIFSALFVVFSLLSYWSGDLPMATYSLVIAVLFNVQGVSFGD